MGWRGPGKSLIFWMALLLIVFISWTYYTGLNQEAAEITYSEFITELERENILEVSFEERKVEGELKDPQHFPSVNSPDAFSKFRTRIPFNDYNYELVNRLEKIGAKVTAKDGKLEDREVILDKPETPNAIRELFDKEKVITIHSEEATLEDIFINITGRGLVG